MDFSWALRFHIKSFYCAYNPFKPFAAGSKVVYLIKFLEYYLAIIIKSYQNSRKIEKPIK